MGDRPLALRERARPGGGAQIEPADRNEAIHRPVARRRAEHLLAHAEKLGQQPPVLLGQPLRAAAIEILMHIGRVAPEQPRQSGEIASPLIDQRRSAVRARSSFDISFSYI